MLSLQGASRASAHCSRVVLQLHLTLERYMLTAAVTEAAHVCISYYQCDVQRITSLLQVHPDSSGITTCLLLCAHSVL